MFSDEDEIDSKAEELRKKLQARAKKRMDEKIAASIIENVIRSLYWKLAIYYGINILICVCYIRPRRRRSARP
jgi:hypothetical protein